jgi:hypothetical protein
MTVSISTIDLMKITLTYALLFAPVLCVVLFLVYRKLATLESKIDRILGGPDDD